MTLLVLVIGLALAPGCGDSDPSRGAEPPPPPAGPWGSSSVVDADMPSGSGSPSVGVDAEGRAIAVWLRAAGDAGDRLARIQARRFVPATGWEATTTLASYPSGDTTAVGFPQIGVDDAGRAFVTWDVLQDGTDASEIARFEPASGWSSAAPFLAGEAGPITRLVIQICGSGTALAVFQRGDRGGVPSTWTSRFEPGSGWRPSQLVESDGHGVRASLGEAGHALLTWSETHPDGTYDYRAIRTDAAGRWGAVETWSGGTLPDFSSAWLGPAAVDGSGTAAVVLCESDVYGAGCDTRVAPPGGEWMDVSEFGVGAIRESLVSFVPVASGESFLAIAKTTPGYTPFGRRYRTGRGVDFVSKLGASELFGGFAASLAGDRAGNGLVAWYYTPNDATTGSPALVAIHFDASEGWSVADDLPADATAATGTPVAALSRSGDALVLWTETEATKAAGTLRAASRHFAAP